MSQFSVKIESAMPSFMKMFGEPVTYKRRENTIENITAITNLAFRPYIVTNDNLRTATNEKEFIIAAEKLEIDGEKFTPKSGDIIVCGSNNYEVTMTNNKQCYQPVEMAEQYLRIFTKKT